MFRRAFFGSTKFGNVVVLLGFVLAGLFLGGVLFYLTPLKHINILNPSVEKISPSDFYANYTQSPSEYVVIDIRSLEYRALEYPDMSISIPLGVLMGQIGALPKNKSIVVFCESNLSSYAAYHVFKGHGFPDVRIIDGGRSAWKEAGLPLMRGDEDRISIANEVIRLKKELGAVPG